MRNPFSTNEHAKWAPWLLFATVLTLFLLFRWNVLFSPLYEDQSVGFGREAEFLSQTHFDYHRLRYEEPHFLFGGTARSYMVSAIPTILALIEKATGSPQSAIFVWHLLSFVLAAFIVSITFAILRQSVGQALALLAAATLALTPMFLAQADLAGMELPLVAFALAAAFAFIRQRFTSAALLASCAFWMKATGALVGVAILAALGLRRLLAPPTLRFSLNRAILVSVLLLAVQVVALWWGDDTALFRATFQWPSAFRLPRVVLWCPDIFLLAGITLVALALALARYGLRPCAKTLWRRFHDGDPTVTLAGLALFVVVGSFASMMGYIFTPRYFILPLCFLYLAMPIALRTSDPTGRLPAIVLVVLLILNGLNVRGTLYPPVAAVAGPDLDVLAILPPRSCGFTERSLEYLEDHRSSTEVIRKIASDHADASIFLEMPHWIYLTSPFVGYVEEPPTNAFRADDFTRSIRAFRDRALGMPPETDLLFLWTARSKLFVPGPSDDVEVLYRDDLTPPMALIRVPRSSLPNTPEALEEWYLDHTWAQDHALHRVLKRYEFLRKTGRSRRAYDELHLAKWLAKARPNSDVAAWAAEVAAELETALRTTATLDGVPWSVFAESGASANLKVDPEENSLKVDVALIPEGGRVRLLGPRRFLKTGDQLTIQVRLRASRPALAILQIERLFEPDRNWQWQQSIDIGTEWKDYQFSLSAPDDEHDATLSFLLLSSNTEYEVGRVQFSVNQPTTEVD